MKCKITTVSGMPILQLGKCVPNWEHEHDRNYPTAQAPAAGNGHVAVRASPTFLFSFLSKKKILRQDLMYLIRIALNFLCRQE